MIIKIKHYKMSKKSILIKEFHHKELVKISNTFGSNYSSSIESMILYFKKTGINPVEAINENPAAMIKVLDKRIVSFLKVQERDILKPLRNEFFQYSNEIKIQNEKLISLVNENIKWVQNSIIKINDFDKSRTITTQKELKTIQNNIKKQQEAIVLIAELIDQKNKTGIQNKIKSIFQ